MPPVAGVSIIVPTYREAANLSPLVERIVAALQPTGITFEIIIVDDDSADGTADIAARLAESHPVRLITRKGERGLSGAVLAGFRSARFDLFVVIDADLQHPPESIPAMLHALNDPSVDFVIATRYAQSGGVDSDWPWWRKTGSRLATLLARPLAPLSDPMSGYFALSRKTWQRAEPFVNPIGYKIALELVVKVRCRSVREISIAFATRQAGESKAGLGVMIHFLRHLWRLYRFRFPLASWCALALAVTLSAILVRTIIR